MRVDSEPVDTIGDKRKKKSHAQLLDPFVFNYTSVIFQDAEIA